MSFLSFIFTFWGITNKRYIKSVYVTLTCLRMWNLFWYFDFPYHFYILRAGLPSEGWWQFASPVLLSEISVSQCQWPRLQQSFYGHFRILIGNVRGGDHLILWLSEVTGLENIRRCQIDISECVSQGGRTGDGLDCPVCLSIKEEKIKTIPNSDI